MPRPKFNNNASRKRKLNLIAARAARKPKLPPQPTTSDLTPVPVPAAPPTTPELPEPPVELPISASKSKLEHFTEERPKCTDFTTQMVLIQIDALCPLFKNFICQECLIGHFTVEVDQAKSAGLVLFLNVICTNCKYIIVGSYTSNKCDSGYFDINRRAVSASLVTGMGHAGLGKFCELINLPNLHQKTYNQHVATIHQRLPSFKDKLLTLAVDKVKAAYPEQSGQEVVNIDVSYDGSWHTRGHSSKTGIGCVIDNRTGLVVDFEVMSKHCQKCRLMESKLQGDLAKRTEWFNNHKPSCDKNHEGSSGSMEQQAAVLIWGRSEEKHGLRYRTVVSDGDTNTIKAIHRADPYPGLVVEKHECVNHVSKRLGTALRNLIDLKKQQKITISGKGKGRLTVAKIKLLQKYYTKSIRSSKNIEDMKRAIWASFWHSTSTDEAPRHDDCPDGETSWCFFKKALAKGSPVRKHLSNSSTYLNPTVADCVKDVYAKMTDEDLLRRCLQGKTQNVNECIHSLIWSRCPKHIFVQRKRLEISVAVGVGEFNMGSRASHEFLLHFGLSIGEQTETLGRKRDRRRISRAENDLKLNVKKRRLLIRQAELRESDRLLEIEGGPQYIAGGSNDI